MAQGKIEFGGFSSCEEFDQWGKDQHEWLAYQAPLRRTAFFDDSATPEEKAEAHRLLLESVQQLNAKHPPLTGDFTYSQSDADEAHEHGF